MRRPYIMLIEDNSDDIELTKRAFAKHHLLNDLEIFRDGAEAAEFLFNSSTTERGLPQVILLDFNLPKISGLELLQQIRSDARTATVPVIMLTSSALQEDLGAGYRHGANSYVRKPVDFDDFVETVGQVGLYWTVLNEAPRPESSS